MVEIAAAHHIVALLVFGQHIAKQHIHLRGPYFIAAAIGRKVHIKEHKLLPVFRGHPADGIAPVQVKKLGKAGGNGQAAPQRTGDADTAEGHHAAVGAAMRLCQRIHEER